MEKPKIFIASSIGAIDFTKILKEELSKDFCEAYIWIEESKNKISLTIIEMLEKASKEFDFAVVILFRDDVDIKEGGAEEQRKAVYNCIFEAGLFMGTLGRERCFLVTDIKSCDLPVYLNGMTYAHLDSLKDLTNHEEYRRAVLETSLPIKNAMREMGKFIKCERLPLLSIEELLKREIPVCDGGELEEGVVVVNDKEPLVRYEFISHVKTNLDNGIRYVCFFPANVDGAQKICLALQILLLTEHFEDFKQATSFQDRLEVLRKNQHQVLNNLQEICKRNSLMICFTQDEPSLQFRIHNATSPEKAILYLRYNNLGFLKWSKGESAMGMWSYMRKFYISHGAAGVFYWTLPLENDIKKKENFKNSIIQELKRHFPEIHDDVRRSCFAETD